jgi:Flp pilus assembly pilin Flp
MKTALKIKHSSFLHDENGAVTVDWVVLTASVVAFGMIAGTIIFNKTGTASEKVATFIGDRSISSTFDK